MTNNPTYDWHVTNMRNYVHLSKYNEEGFTYGESNKVEGTGEGSGMLGTPGDYTPASRFIRAVALKRFSTQPRNAARAINLGFHILNNVDIAKGKKLSKLNYNLTTF